MVKIPDTVFLLHVTFTSENVRNQRTYDKFVLNSRSRSEAPSSKQIDSVCSILDQCVLSP